MIPSKVRVSSLVYSDVEFNLNNVVSMDINESGNWNGSLDGKDGHKTYFDKFASDDITFFFSKNIYYVTNKEIGWRPFALQYRT